jgi:hypothetical protein
MELKEFVSETLKQIAEGVSEAQQMVKERGAIVNPKLVGDWREGAKHGLLLTVSGKKASVVEYDVAVTVREEAGKKGGIGVLAGAIALGGQGQTSSENSSISRIKFNVTLELPSQ